MISDNAANMKAAGREVAHHMSFSTCMSHTGNLLAKDLINMNVKRKVDSVQEHFRKLRYACLVEEKGGKRPKTPSEIRWCYQR